MRNGVGTRHCSKTQNFPESKEGGRGAQRESERDREEVTVTASTEAEIKWENGLVEIERRNPTSAFVTKAFMTSLRETTTSCHASCKL